MAGLYTFQYFYGLLGGTVDSVALQGSDRLVVEATCKVTFSSSDLDMMTYFLPKPTWFVSATLYEKDVWNPVQAKQQNISSWQANVDDNVKLLGRPNGNLIRQWPGPGEDVPYPGDEFEIKFTSTVTPKQVFLSDDWKPKYVTPNRRVYAGFLIWSPYSLYSPTWRPTQNVLVIPTELDNAAKFV